MLPSPALAAATVTPRLLPPVSSRVADPFERLFLQEYPKVVAIANRVLADPHRAEDVAQDVFLQFHRRHSAEAGYAAPWLHAAAAHAALNVLRGDKRRTRRETAHATEGASTAPDPVIVLEEAERRRMVRAALLRLPAKSASVLALRYSGLSYAEIGAALRVRVGNVGTMLHRAEAALRKEVNRAPSE